MALVDDAEVHGTSMGNIGCGMARIAHDLAGTLGPLVKALMAL